MREFITLLVVIYCHPLFAIDIDDLQSQVFDGSCELSGCHNGSTLPNLSSGVAFDAIVNANSNQSTKLLIAPSSISGSYLIDKLEGTGTGSSMPIGDSLTSVQKDLVRNWISEGALEDDTPSDLDTDTDTDTDTDADTDTDTDSDGVPDPSDNCANNANRDQLDTDSDGDGDVCDNDDDGDGVPDNADAFPIDGSESVDSDTDGLGNNADRDDDNDGMPDRYEVFAGHDPLVNDASDVVNDNSMTKLEVYRALPKSNQYLQNTSDSLNIARLHIVNTGENAQRFTGTVFDLNGSRLGSAYQSLGAEVPAKGRLVLDSGDFESLFDIDPWIGPAMVEVVGTDKFSLMSKLVSRSGLISNTNCVRENRILNIERYNPDGVTYVRLINSTENAMGSIKGTLYDSSGTLVGSADTELVSSLLPKQMVWISSRRFEQLFGRQWDGEAMLEVSEIKGLKLLNLNLINGETFFNFSCFERGNEFETGRVYLQTSTKGPNISMTHLVNTSDNPQAFTATMYKKGGAQLGAANQVLGNAASKGRVIVSTKDLEEVFGVSPWDGPSMLEVSGSGSFELMTKQTSRSGLISNVNCVRQNQVHNIEGMDSPAITYIRFINTGDTTINNVTGTLYDSSGSMVGPSGQTILETLAPKAQVFINRDSLIDIFDDVTWNGEVMMEVEADEALRLLNLNQINNETFFNFSCYENSNNTSEVTGQEFFNSNVSDQVVQGVCADCHIEGGLAEGSALVYAPSSTLGHETSNFNLLQAYAIDDPGDANIILNKSRGIKHGGGVQLDTESDDYQSLVTFLSLIGGDIDTTNSGSLGEFWEGVSMASPEETLRRGAIITAKTLPGTAQIAAVQAGGEDALRTALRDQMEGDGFHEFLTTGANDRLFTDAFIDGNLFFESINLQATVFFPVGANKYYEEQPRDDNNNDPDAVNWLREWFWGMTQSPLELIAYVIENDRSYQEVLTADYMMLNPRTNEILNGGLTFEADANHRNYLPGSNNGQIVRDDQLVAEFSSDMGVQVTSWGPYVDYPHAGVLNTHAFLARYPTTETNRNRARARWTYYHFLGVDIEKSANRTTDAEALTDTNNPTMNNSACTVCHELHDPVAGTFQNYGNEGIYRDKQGGLDSLPGTYKYPSFSEEDTEPGLYKEGDTWFADMREPGLDAQLASNPDNSLQWLGNEIANDSRFGAATVAFWWPAVMGAASLVAPELTDAADYAEKLAAFEEQTTFINDLGAEFVAGINGGRAYNGKDLLVEMMLSPWFMAKEVEAGASTVGAGATVANIGVRRLLTPAELEAKTTELLGWTWGNVRAPRFQYDGVYTSLVDQFGIYYGDIDSNGIKSRSQQLTSLMANVAERQAVSMACSSVVVDFFKTEAERVIFDGINQDITPATEFVDEFEVTASSLESTETFITTGTLSEGSKTVIVSFTNDFYEEGEGDRNLVVTALRLTDGAGNVIAQANLANFDNIVGATATCGGANLGGYTLWSNCQLSIPFTIDSASTVSVEVDAWGQQAGPELVAMSVAVNDENYVGGNTSGAIAIKNQLIDMHSDFLGESLTLTSDELEASYLLFVETWQDRLSQSDNGWAWNYPDENCYFWDSSQWSEDGPANQASDANGILYTWTTILIYLMTDFYYLHE